ncbi:MAG: chemotaxis protein CheX [Deltaproteobacteria bacterium]|nr:chemotaxis protein CheX [Deltaproteobacteria bacterium]
MKAEMINPFLEATVSVLKTMAFIEPTPGKPYIKNGASATGDVSGIVGIVGDAEGTLCLSFAKTCILHIIGKMFGEEKTEINDEVKDAVGELTNVISGDSRRRLEEIGYHFLGAVPSVISGMGHEVRHVTKGPILCIPFKTEAGSFTVEVCFK